MRSAWIHYIVVGLLVVATLGGRTAFAAEDDLTAEKVLLAIDRGRSYLIRQQNDNGSWTVGIDARFGVGITSLAVLALINSGMTAKDPEVKKGLDYLRSVRDPEPDFVYDIALMIMALSAAKDGQRDVFRMQQLAQKLEEAQTTAGRNRGSWGYTHSKKEAPHWTGDRSNAQYAILGLHAAAEAGVPIKREVWERARQHWLDTQNSDGGWSYTNEPNFRSSTGSMTVAGIASLAITEEMLRDPTQDETPDGKPICCGQPDENAAIENGVKWMAEHFAVGRNPGNASGRILYYLYGMERAGRLSARRFFGIHDWYRRGADYLVRTQNRGQLLGAWKGVGQYEQEPVIGTSFALLFLSKGLAPVLVQKLMYGPPDGQHGVLDDNWNRHRWDVRKLVENISGRPKWPQLVTWQVLDLNKVVADRSVAALRQAPILYLSGEESYRFTEQDAALIRAYIDQGGFVLAVGNCPDKSGGAFEQSVRDLVGKMYPLGSVSLEPLPEDHLIWRSEFLVRPDQFDLLGADIGCRTAIVYSRSDLSCLWDKLERPEPEQRSDTLKQVVEQGFRMGVNIVAYATGREPPNKLDAEGDEFQQGEQDQVERGLLQVAKLKHEGGWDVAPHALRNLLMGLNRTVGDAATTKQRALDPQDQNIYKYPLVYMHGRSGFDMNEAQLEQLRSHLLRGGVLFADACCGSTGFDESFREMVAQLFPDQAFARIPVTHELFTDRTFYDITTVRRRVPEVRQADQPLEIVARRVEPFLEGIEIDGRLVIIYSKYDISCALERQVSVACPGYIPEDALKIGINVVMHALLQDANYQP